MRRESDLSDREWLRIQALLPPRRRQGRPRADDRTTINGILFALKTGCRWQDLPEEYGSHVTCWRRHSKWVKDGTWARIWGCLTEGIGSAPVGYCTRDGAQVIASAQQQAAG